MLNYSLNWGVWAESLAIKRAGTTKKGAGFSLRFVRPLASYDLVTS